MVCIAGGILIKEAAMPMRRMAFDVGRQAVAGQSARRLPQPPPSAVPAATQAPKPPTTPPAPVQAKPPQRESNWALKNTNQANFPGVETATSPSQHIQSMQPSPGITMLSGAGQSDQFKKPTTGGSLTPEQQAKVQQAGAKKGIWGTLNTPIGQLF